MSIDHGINLAAINGTAVSGTSLPTVASVTRAAGVHHRSAVTSVDKLLVPTVSAATAVTESGSTLANVSYNYTAAAGNRWGPTTGAAVQSITPTANQAVRIPITAVTGADYYDIFLSTDAAPKGLARITETQRAAGGFIISTVGTVTAGGGAAAGQVDCGAVGTGLAWNVNPFASNNAVTPASITPINCSGYNIAYLYWKVTVNDLRVIPTFSMTVFVQNSGSTSDWHRLGVFTESLLTGAQNAISSARTQTVNGSTNMVVVVDTLTGTGASVDIWVELV